MPPPNDVSQATPAWPSTQEWPAVSPRIRQLFRAAAGTALAAHESWTQAMREGARAGSDTKVLADDPALGEAKERFSAEGVYNWATANVECPGERVPALISAENLECARDLARRGLGMQTLDILRMGSNAGWRYWMAICFHLTSDAPELRELLDLSALSIATYMNDLKETLDAHIQADRDAYAAGSQAERRATLDLIMEGTPILQRRAEEQLRYGLSGPHVAVVVWGRLDTTSAALEQVVEVLIQRIGAPRHLAIAGSSRALWLWFPVRTIGALDTLEGELAGNPGIHVVFGRAGEGVEGFRRSHLDALASQKTLVRLISPRQLARYEDVQLVEMLTSDRAQTHEFVTDTLGDLATAGTELRETLLVYLKEQSSTARTAERLYTHRNTALRRVERAQGLLPRPLTENLIAVAAALEIAYWQGSDC